MTIDKLLDQLKSYAPPDGIKLVRNAYEFAEVAHRGQTRKTGDPYIEHPLHAAYTLALIHLDCTTIAAALLHDIVEDTDYTIKDIKTQFGDEIASLVEGATKLGKVRISKNFPSEISENKDDAFSPHSYLRQVDVLRKMFIAMAEDIRVILIKLADRLHNMETLSVLPQDKQLRIARETLEIYAPIAHRLGMGELKGQLEDLAFPYVYQKEYQALSKTIGRQYDKRTRYLQKVQKVLEKELAEAHIKGEISGRTKHLYSLFRKLQRYNTTIDHIYDLVALRIITDSVEDCYTVLGIIHKHWKPLTGRIKDYISVPKPTGYQSLHTTVFCLDGQITEFQIRTHAMHEQAEYGIAAHWHYKTQQNSPQPAQNRPHQDELEWVKQLADWQTKLTDPDELTETVKLDFFEDRIFVFTPKGDVHNLPLGATPVDFAFAIHTDIGLHCAGAKVNGKMVTLNSPLQSGDMVQIITSKKAVPHSDWLNFTKTSHARSMIRQHSKDLSPSQA